MSKTKAMRVIPTPESTRKEIMESFERDLEARIAYEYQARSNIEILELIEKDFRREVLRRARWPEHSTSQPHNLVHLQLASAMAEELERIESCVNRMRRAPQ